MSYVDGRVFAARTVLQSASDVRSLSGISAGHLSNVAPITNSSVIE
jgi:hypothetical protein